MVRLPRTPRDLLPSPEPGRRTNNPIQNVPTCRHETVFRGPKVRFLLFSIKAPDGHVKFPLASGE
jgi:hypothetical protein